MKQKEIVWVNVPYSNFEDDKPRPALIVSNNEYNERNLDVIICAITSNLEKKPYSIFISNENFSIGKMPIQSKIKVDKIMQIEKTRLKEKIAVLNDQTFDLVIMELLKLVSRP
ncbi:MAG: type II toxin-antitoxin system PemK/MazF family toxin [Candidatus Micrarchaeota archaeon]